MEFRFIYFLTMFQHNHHKYDTMTYKTETHRSLHRCPVRFSNTRIDITKRVFDHPCPNFRGGLANPPLFLWHGSLIASHIDP